MSITNSKEMFNLNRAVLYTRVSTNKDEQEKSLQIQEEVYKDYCKHKGYELIQIYPDKGTATSVRQRPEFLEMMRHAGLDYEVNNEGTDIFRTSDRESKFDIIIVKDASRFSRNIEIGVATVNRLKDKDVTVIFENAGISSTDPNAQFILPLLFSMAENESISLSKKIKFSKRFIAEKKQEYKPSRVPYGYKKVDGKIVIDEDEEEVIKFIFSRFKEVGGNTVAKELKDKEILTKLEKNWSTHQVIRTIKNRIYTGTAISNQTDKKNVTDTKRYETQEEDWVEIFNAVPPIISQTEWENANEIRENRRDKKKNRGIKQPAPDNLYYKKATCGNCGSGYNRHVGRNTTSSKAKISYLCQNRRNKNGCNNKSVTLQILERSLSSIEYYDIIQDEKHLRKQDELFNLILKNLGSYKNIMAKRAKELEDERDMLAQELDQVVTRSLDGKLNDIIAKALNDKAENIQAQINIIDGILINTSAEKIRNYSIKLQDHILKVVNLIEERELHGMLKNVQVFDDKLIFKFTINSFHEILDDYNVIMEGTEYKINPMEYDIGAVEIETKRL